LSVKNPELHGNCHDKPITTQLGQGDFTNHNPPAHTT